MDSRRTVALVIIAILILAAFVFFAAIPKFLPQGTDNGDAGTATPRAATTTPAPATSTEPSPLSLRVSIDSPKSGATVAQKFAISGKAPGNWYFEAVFPIIVTAADGSEIARAQGRAQGDWMTTELVPFTAEIDAGSYTGPATVNLLRDNPSGLPENEDSVSIDIIIK